MSRSKLRLVNFYYLFTIIIYFSGIYFPFIRVGVSMSLLMIIGIIILYINKSFSLKNQLDILVFLYIIYNIFSFVFFTFSGLPMSVFIKEFSNSILPIIIFYFFGKINDYNSFYKITLYSLVVCFIIGFYFQFTVPSNYAIFMNKIDSIGTDPAHFKVNYRSFLGLTATGSLSALGVLLSFGILQKSKFKKGKIMLSICFIALILTFRRAALYTGFFALLWINYLLFFKFKGAKFKLLLLEFLIFFSFMYYFLDSNPEFLDDLLERFSSLSSAVDERSDSWFNGLSNTQNLLFGDGLGRYGHKAVEYSKLYIPDGNYFRMIGELGIFGFLLFIFIIFTSIYNALPKLKESYIELGVVIMVCMQAVGSDIISFQLVAPIFWYSIGRCSRYSSLNKKKVLV